VNHWFKSDLMTRTLLNGLPALFVLTSQAAPFRNLDFQSPNTRVLSTMNSGSVYLVKDVIPGWRVQYGSASQDVVFYNGGSQLFASAQLYGPSVPRRGDKFEFSMKSGLFFDGIGNATGAAIIYQIGEVPPTAKSISFEANIYQRYNDLHVSLGGQLLTLIELEKTGDFNHYAADVSAWAGKTSELRFSIEPGDYQFDSYVFLGNIRFSAIPAPAIPEPSTWALLITGLAALAWNHRRRA